MFHPAGAAWIAELMLDRIEGLKVDYVGGLAIGAVPLVNSIAMLSHQRGRPIPGFFVRAQVKDHGTARQHGLTSRSKGVGVRRKFRAKPVGAASPSV